MTANEILPALEEQYIDNGSSNTVRVSLEGGNLLYGEFIKAMQFKHNRSSNKWIITCQETDITLDGENIIDIKLSTDTGNAQPDSSLVVTH